MSYAKAQIAKKKIKGNEGPYGAQKARGGSRFTFEIEGNQFRAETCESPEETDGAAQDTNP